MADKGHPSKVNRAWLRRKGIAATILERDDQIVHRLKRHCFNKLKQWRGIAMRSDKTARNYHAGLCLAAILHWLTSILRGKD